ncbi:MAG: hypothetical protein ACOH1P_12125 [Lysobacter sp.]
MSEEPIRVEIINREEIEEKLLMSPGNISMLVAETGGIRVQSTAPALGASNIRIQGLRGREDRLGEVGLTGDVRVHARVGAGHGRWSFASRGIR